MDSLHYFLQKLKIGGMILDVGFRGHCLTNWQGRGNPFGLSILPVLFLRVLTSVMSVLLQQPELRARWAKVTFGLLIAFITYCFLAPQHAVKVSSFNAGAVRSDLVVHLIVFGAIAFFAFSMQTSKLLGTNLVLICLYAVTIEVLQAYVPNRTCDLYDLGANFLGILSGLLMLNLYRKLQFCWKYGFESRLPTPIQLLNRF